MKEIGGTTRQRVNLAKSGDYRLQGVDSKTHLNRWINKLQAVSPTSRLLRVVGSRETSDLPENDKGRSASARIQDNRQARRRQTILHALRSKKEEQESETEPETNDKTTDFRYRDPRA